MKAILFLLIALFTAGATCLLLLLSNSHFGMAEICICLILVLVGICIYFSILKRKLSKE